MSDEEIGREREGKGQMAGCAPLRAGPQYPHQPIAFPVPISLLNPHPPSLFSFTFSIFVFSFTIVIAFLVPGIADSIPIPVDSSNGRSGRKGLSPNFKWQLTRSGLNLRHFVLVT